PLLWISGPLPPDSWRSLQRATYPQLLHHLKGHDPRRLDYAGQPSSRAPNRGAAIGVKRDAFALAGAMAARLGPTANALRRDVLVGTSRVNERSRTPDRGRVKPLH